MSFLQAEWKKLAIANYLVDPALLQKYLPPKTELDLWNNRCYISLIGFMFLNTKLLGIPIPFHRDFEEVNLRFYVRHFEDGTWKRGVVFIKEFVPKIALSMVANYLYKEHYETVPMSHQWRVMADRQLVEYSWKCRGVQNRFTIEAGVNPQVMGQGSEVEFITEHYWGYTKAGPTSTIEYEVTHPRWQHYVVDQYQIEVDYGLSYGKEFAYLQEIQPISVMLAEGSEITVENKKQI